MSRRAILALVAAVLLASVGLWKLAAVGYPHLLPFEQKLAKGYLAAAYNQAYANVLADPTRENLTKLVRALTLKGNLGRADLVAHAAGIEEPALETARDFELQVLAEARATGTIANHFAAGELLSLQCYPVYQDLKFFVGYQQALLGDWNAALDYFSMAWRDGVSPELKPYVQYYYARALIRAGDDREKLRGHALLAKLATGADRYGLSARVTLNQLQAAIADGQERLFETYLSHIARHSTLWEHAKARAALGQYYLDKHQPVPAARHFLRAVADNPQAFGTARLIALGLVDAMAVLEGDLSGIEDDLVTRDGRNLLYSWVQALATLDETERARESLTLTAAREDNGDSRFLAYEALSLLYYETGEKKDFEKLLLRENLESAPDEVVQTSLLNFARLLYKRGETFPARGYFESAERITGKHTSEARFEHYMLLKERSPSLDADESIKLLSPVVDDPLSEHRLEACEELIALAVREGRHELAQQAIETVNELAPDVAVFWRIYLAEKEGNDTEAGKLRDALRVRNFSYYELQPLEQLTRARIAIEDRAFYLWDEHVAEYLASYFLMDLALTVCSVAEMAKLPAVPAAIALRNAELTSSIQHSSWLATELLEQGPVFDYSLNDYVVKLAFPTPYLDEVRAASKRYEVPAELIYAVMKKESNFDPQATSPAGAQGLMQLMPATAGAFNLFLPDDLRGRELIDCERNIHLGTAYLASLRTAYRGDYLVLSAYNGGPGNLNRWLESVGTRSQTSFVDLIPNSENEHFVKKTLKYSKIYQMILRGE